MLYFFEDFIGKNTNIYDIKLLYVDITWNIFLSCTFLGVRLSMALTMSAAANCIVKDSPSFATLWN